MNAINEVRADRGAAAVLFGCADVDSLDLHTALSDVLANLAHLAQRAGLDPDPLFERALRSWRGDFEDGPPVKVNLDASQLLPRVKGLKLHKNDE